MILQRRELRGNSVFWNVICAMFAACIATAHVCAEDMTNNVVCWGSLDTGETVSPNFNDPSNLPVQLACGAGYTIALLADGTLTVWGEGYNNSHVIHESLDPPPTPIQSISCNYSKNGALLSDGTLVVWGAYTPAGQTYGSVADFEWGVDHLCYLSKSGAIGYWGDNEWGQLDTPDGLYPSETPVVNVAAGNEYTLALLSNGLIAGWGKYNTPYSPPSPYRWVDAKTIPPEIPAVQIFAGHLHAAAILENGEMICWGSNTYGQCEVPDEIQGRIVKCALGSSTSVAILDDGTVHIWGREYALAFDEINLIAPGTSQEISVEKNDDRYASIAYPACRNLTSTTNYSTIQEALVEANSFDDLLADASAFQQNNLDLGGQYLSVKSRSVINTSSTDEWTLGDTVELESVDLMSLGGITRVLPGSAITFRPNSIQSPGVSLQIPIQGQMYIENNGSAKVVADGSTEIYGELSLSTQAELTLVGGGSLDVFGGTLTNIGGIVRSPQMLVGVGDVGLARTFCLGCTFDIDEIMTQGGEINLLDGVVIGNVAVDSHLDSGTRGHFNASGTMFGDLSVIDGRTTSLGDFVVVGDLYNYENGVVVVQVGTMYVTGSIVNSGQIYGDVVGSPGFVGGGTQEGDGIAIGGDLVLGPEASLRFYEPLWRLTVGGNFDVAITSPNQFELIGATLAFDGSSGHVQSVEVTSRDIGPDPLAFTDPPTDVSLIRRLEIASTSDVSLVDVHMNATGKKEDDEALYTTQLVVHAGGSLATNGTKIYCAEALIDGEIDDPGNVVVVSILPDPDFNEDGHVNGGDLAFILVYWGTDTVDIDLNGDGNIDAADLGLLLGSWTG